MKKQLFALLSCVLLITACGTGKPAADTTDELTSGTEETTEEVTTEEVMPSQYFRA